MIIFGPLFIILPLVVVYLIIRSIFGFAALPFRIAQAVSAEKAAAHQLELQTVAAMPDAMKEEYWRRKAADADASNVTQSGAPFWRQPKLLATVGIIAAICVYGHFFSP